MPIDGEEVSCGEPTDSGRKTTTYSISVSNLPSGEHEFVITLTLVRKGTHGLRVDDLRAPAGEPISFETACVDYGGTFGPNGPLANVCLKEYASHEDAEADFDNFFAALDPTCRGDADLGGGLGTGSTIDFNCATEGHLQLLAICPEDASSNSVVDVVSCQTPDASIREPFRALCLQTVATTSTRWMPTRTPTSAWPRSTTPETACRRWWHVRRAQRAGMDLLQDLRERRRPGRGLEELTSSLNVACDQRVPYGITRPTETSLSYGCGNDTVTRLDNLRDAPGRGCVGSQQGRVLLPDVGRHRRTVRDHLRGGRRRVSGGRDDPAHYVCEDPVSTG